MKEEATPLREGAVIQGDANTSKLCLHIDKLCVGVMIAGKLGKVCAE